MSIIAIVQYNLENKSINKYVKQNKFSDKKK